MNLTNGLKKDNPQKNIIAGGRRAAFTACITSSYCWRRLRTDNRNLIDHVPHRNPPHSYQTGLKWTATEHHNNDDAMEWVV